MALLELTAEPSEIQFDPQSVDSVTGIHPRRAKGDQVDQWRAEFDKFFLLIQDLQNEDPADVFVVLAGIGARAAEIRGQLVRMATRKSDQFRTQEVDYLLDALKFQFQCYSRAVSVRSLDQELSGKTV